MTQAEQNQIAIDLLNSARGRLDRLVSRIGLKKAHPEAFLRTQELWMMFAEHQARERAGLFGEHGTIATVEFAGELEAAINERIKQLEIIHRKDL